MAGKTTVGLLAIGAVISRARSQPLVGERLRLADSATVSSAFKLTVDALPNRSVPVAGGNQRECRMRKIPGKWLGMVTGNPIKN
jgi:hypothetical protein